MNYNVLRYFSVLAQVEHYSVAAARLGISQPSLSSAIHNLETDLGGVKLFEKVGRNIRLTDEGKFYQEKVDAALLELHEATALLRDSRTLAPVVIRLGYVSGTLEGTLARRIAEYTLGDRRIRFRLRESSARELMDLVRQEELDMAIVDSTDRDRSLHFRKLKERDLMVALPQGHPLAHREQLDPRDMAREPQVAFDHDVSGSFREWAAADPGEEQILCTVDTISAALELVEKGVGFAVVPKVCSEPRNGVVYVPVINRHQALYMCILYDKWLEPPVWDFVEYAVKAIREEG